jgi:hypothetical protein
MAVAVAICAIGAFGPTASASAASCETGIPLAEGIVAPATVAYGRDFAAYPEEAFPGGGWYLEEEVPWTFTFNSATPGVNLSDAYVVQESHFSQNQTHLVEFMRGEGPGVFSVSWTQGHGARYANPPTYKECTATTSVTTVPIEGKLGRVRPTLDYSHGNSYLRLTMRCPGVRLEEIDQSSSTPLHVVIQGAGARRSVLAPDVCGEGGGPTFRTRHWAGGVVSFSTHRAQGDVLTIKAKALDDQPKVIRFKVSQAGKPLGSGHVTAETYSKAGKFIYEGSDAFVNYCIDHGQEINSINHRLYCIFPGYSRSYITGLHWSSPGNG